MDSVQFSGSSIASRFMGKSVKSGVKATGSAFPQLILASTKDKFVLNQRALAMLGIEKGSYVVMYDENLGANPTDDRNVRFFITRGWVDAKGNPVGAKVGKDGSFSYTGVYSAMLMNDKDITGCTSDDLVRAGKASYAKESENFISKTKLFGTLKKVTVDDENGNVIDKFEVSEGRFQEMYVITDIAEEEHVPGVDVDDEGEATQD